MKRDRAHQPRIEHANPSFYTLYLWVLSGHPFVRLADKQQQQMATASDTWPNDLGAVTIDALESSRAFWHTLPFQYLFIGHALFCSLPGAQFKDKWLVHLLLTFLWGNGGGLVTAALIMQPKVATFSFFQADFITGGWIVCWWLVNWSPGGLPAKLLSVWWIKMLAKSCTMLLRAQLIISRVDLAVQLFPGVVSAPLILGTIAGCGGRLLADGIMTGWQSMPGLAELSSPGFVSRSAAFAAVSYYVLAYATQLLPIHAAAGLIETGLMLHAFASDLTGLPLDFTAPVTHLLHTITCVPAPPPQPQPAHVTVSMKRVTAKQLQQAGSSSPAKSPAKAPAKSPAKQSPAAKRNGPTAAAVADAAASPLANGTARKKRGTAAAAADDGEPGDDGPMSPAGAEAPGQSQQQRGRPRRSVAPEAVGDSAAVGGVTTRRRAAAAVAYA